MKRVEIRRHSLRDKPDEHLSLQGRKLAHQVGLAAGPFQRVLSSPSIRALETASEMGFSDPEPRPGWMYLGDECAAEVGWPAPFARYALLLRSDTATRRKAQALRSELEEFVGSLSDAKAGLIVTHGVFPELVAVALFPSADHAGWGGALRCMEGIRLTFEDEGARECEVLRLPLAASRM